MGRLRLATSPATRAPDSIYVLANAFKATGAAALRTLYRVAEQIVQNDRPVIYLYHPIQYAGVSTSVVGVSLVLTQIRVAFAQFK